jgi:hypothetical protein
LETQYGFRSRLTDGYWATPRLRSLAPDGRAIHARGLRVDCARSELPAEPEKLTRAEAAIAEPIVFHHVEGTRLRDFVGTTWALLALVSDRLISVLRDGR